MEGETEFLFYLVVLLSEVLFYEERNRIFILLEIKQVVFDAATENWRR